MEPSKLEKVIQRIQQARKLAESTHSRHEKEAAAAFAAKLIAEHQLSEAEIEAHSGKKDEEVFTDQESDYNVVYESGRVNAWKQELCWGLAKLNGVYCLHYPMRNAVSHRRGSRFRVFGRKSDIEITKYMFTYLVTTIQSLAEDYVPGRIGQRGVNPERESWSNGCVKGFLAKMNAEKAEVMKAATSTAMVLVGNREKDAREALCRDNPALRIGHRSFQSKAQRDEGTFNSGYRKGQTLSVNPGLDSSGSAPKRLT